MISATQAYNYIQCPHRVALDAHGDPALREEPNAFVELLWQNGIAHESDMVSRLDITVNLSQLPPEEREQETRMAMARGEPLIYQGRLTVGDRVGEPDLLELHPGGYRAGDIKSGAGLEGDEVHGKLKKTYAIQAAHYTSMLDEIGRSDRSEEAFIVDVDGQHISYPLAASQGVRKAATWMDTYAVVLADLRHIAAGTKHTRPALSAACKLCHWQTSCRQDVVASNDLSLIAELGRSKRDTMLRLIPTVQDLATANLGNFTVGKKTVFPGIGPTTLQKYQNRAILLSTPGAEPYLKIPVDLPTAAKEVYFDIEADPMRRGYVYLHGFVERLHGQPETARFAPRYTADISPAAEEEAFRQAWNYLVARLADAITYYYSPYERAAYKALASRFPSVCSVADVEALFAEPVVIDLYTDVVKQATEWPTYDQSIKTLAKFLGFSWRDTNPSGAASIQWFDDWVNTGNSAILQRILDYNEDDCLATGVVVDGVRRLKMKPANTL